jgi:hypothetical protein
MKLQKNVVTQFYAFLRIIASSMIFYFSKFGYETLQFLRKGIDQIPHKIEKITVGHLRCVE